MRLGRFWMLALVWAAVIFALSSLPGRAFSNVPGVGYDKVAHVTVYAVLGSVLYLAARSTWTVRPLRLVLACTLAALTYGLSDEFHQTFVPGRSASGWDVVADGVGGLVGAGLASLLSTVGRRWPRTSERAL